VAAKSFIVWWHTGEAYGLQCSYGDAQKVWDAATKAAEEKFTSTNMPIMSCERRSCCNCGNVSCPLNGVNCSKFVPRTSHVA
jgi:hypothetical protein